MPWRIGARGAAAFAAVSIGVVGAGCSGSSSSSGVSTTTSFVVSLGALGGSASTTRAGAPQGTAPRASAATAVGQTSVRLTDVQPAVKAVEQALGGPQRYTEINVDVQNVNLFVAKGDGTELAYLYRTGTLSPPESPMPQEQGAVNFSLDTVNLDKVAGFQTLLSAQLPGATIARVVLISNKTDGFVWHLYVEGAKQAKFIVGLAVDGTTVTGILSD